MGRGRKPCCDKSKVKKGPWSPEEDLRLITYIQKHGHENWRNLPKQAGLLRCGKSCRLRWINYLRPDVKRGNFTLEEEETIIRLHESLGNKWSQIASQLPGRTDNEIKNVWNTYLKKKVAGRDNDSAKIAGREDSTALSSSSSSSVSVDSDGMTALEKEKRGDTEEVPMDAPSFQLQLSTRMGLGNNEKEFSVNSVSSESNVTNSSPVDISIPEEQMNCLFMGPSSDEVNKPELEIPLESDLDFWSILEADNFGLLEPNVEVQASEATNYCSPGASIFEEKLRYLKHELGLDDPVDEDQDSVGMNSTDRQPISSGFDQSIEASDAEFDQEILSFLDIDI